MPEVPQMPFVVFGPEVRPLRILHLCRCDEMRGDHYAYDYWSDFGWQVPPKDGALSYADVAAMVSDGWWCTVEHAEAHRDALDLVANGTDDDAARDVLRRADTRHGR